MAAGPALGLGSIIFNNNNKPPPDPRPRGGAGGPRNREGQGMRNLRGSVVVITGASSGLGSALALRYAAPGVRLHLGGRSAERLRRYVYSAGDLRDPAEAYTLFRGRMPNPQALMRQRGLGEVRPEGAP